MTPAPPPPKSGTEAGSDSASPRWLAFTAVCVAYLATTTGESLLAPILPIAAPDLGLDLSIAGTAFFVLAASIAVANIVGGILLRYHAANRVLAVALATSATGGAIAAASHTTWTFVGAQMLVGAGAGLLYPAAIMSVGTFAGPQRRGLAMGIFGVFFSGGLTLAAVLAGLGTDVDWRWSYAIGVGLAAVAALTVWPLRGAPKSRASGSTFEGWRDVLGAPTFVGVVGGISQYATVSFLPLFAVQVWSVGEGRAASLLAIGRVLSIPAKLITGSLADRVGPIVTARLSGVVLAVAGTAWALAPQRNVAEGGAVLFTAVVSGLFPLANLLAFERVGRQGGALGVFRSLQLGAGAVAGLVVGWSAHAIGLRSTVAIGALLPLALVALRGGRRSSD